jgi:hypothetical protein
LPDKNIENKESVIDETLQFFIKYYVRRNITDFPNTRDLEAINMDVIEKCDKYLKKGNKLKSQFITKAFLNGKEKPSSINDLKDGLEDNLFITILVWHALSFPNSMKFHIQENMNLIYGQGTKKACLFGQWSMFCRRVRIFPNAG